MVDAGAVWPYVAAKTDVPKAESGAASEGRAARIVIEVFSEVLDIALGCQRLLLPGTGA